MFTLDMKKKQHRQNLKWDILQVTKELFLQYGYRNTSMRKIATKIGISPTTIY